MTLTTGQGVMPSVRQIATLEEGHSPVFPWRQPDQAALNFDVAGISHLLVRRSEWRQETASMRGDGEVVGEMLFAGEQHVVLRLPAETARSDAAVPLSQLLTHREMEVALLVAEGKCDKEIARSLGISGHTVREHVRRSMAKLNVSRRPAIVFHVLSVLAGTRS